jgi:hypothetical protein
MERYEVFIPCGAMDVPASFAAKFEWLGRHFPFIPSSHIVFCGDKSVIAADYLIDDEPRHVARFGGEGILFTTAQSPGDRRSTGRHLGRTGVTASERSQPERGSIGTSIRNQTCGPRSRSEVAPR